MSLGWNHGLAVALLWYDALPPINAGLDDLPPWPPVADDGESGIVGPAEADMLVYVCKGTNNSSVLSLMYRQYDTFYRQVLFSCGLYELQGFVGLGKNCNGKHKRRQGQKDQAKQHYAVTSGQFNFLVR